MGLGDSHSKSRRLNSMVKRKPGVRMLRFALWQHEVATVNSLYVSDHQEMQMLLMPPE